jgi:hypothetical protein
VKKQKPVSSAVDLQNASENFRMEVLNNLKLVKNMPKKTHSEFHIREI